MLFKIYINQLNYYDSEIQLFTGFGMFVYFLEAMKINSIIF